MSVTHIQVKLSKRMLFAEIQHRLGLEYGGKGPEALAGAGATLCVKHRSVLFGHPQNFTGTAGQKFYNLIEARTRMSRKR